MTLPEALIWSFYFPKTLSQDKSIFKKVLECCLALGDAHEEINEKMIQAKLPFVDYKTSSTYRAVRVAKKATSSIDDIFGAAVLLVGFSQLLFATSFSWWLSGTHQPFDSRL